MDSIIEEIKAQVKLVDLVGHSFQVTGKGRTLTTVEHDSLKLWPATGRWWWFSQGLGGDVIDWHRHIHRCDLATAIDDLAALAGIARRTPTAAELEERNARRRQAMVLVTAAEWFQRQLWSAAGEQARLYCASRGWSPETMKREGIGFCPIPAPVGASDNKALSDGGLRQAQPLATVLREAGLLDEPMARAVLAMPQGMLVYVHRDHGQPVYLAGRSIEGKRHWNLPSELAGGKRVYVNEPAQRGGIRVLVEGQADAVALGQLGIDAVALCGLDGPAPGLDVSHVMLDGDHVGQAKALSIAAAIDPLCRLTAPPKGAKDAAEAVATGLGDGVLTALESAPMVLMVLAERAGKQRDKEKRQAALDEFFRRYEALEEVVRADLKPDLARALCGSIGQFNRLLKAYEQAHQEKEKASAERYEHSCGQVRGGFVFEQCVVRDGDGQCQVMFAVRRPDGKIEMRKTLDVGSTCYIPYPGNTAVIDKEVVLFPERPEEYGSPGDLVNEVRAFIHKYLDIDPFYEKLAAYYVLFTWVYDLFENVPYCRALGDYGTGKTRFLQAIGAVCYRPMFVSGAATVSPIFRLLHMFRGTLIIDEADFSNSDAEAEIIKILNVGYYRGGVVLRSERDANSDEYFPSVNEVYGPKILATRKPFTDRATESRCLTKRMQTRRPRPGIPYTVSGEFWREARALRNKLLMYRLHTHRPVTVDQSLADESVEPRLNQITMALKTIVEDPVMRTEIDTFIRAYNDLLIGERQLTLPAIVVQAVAGIFFAEKRNLMGEDMRDLSMKGITEKALAILQDIDSEAKLTPRRVSMTLNEDLGLTRRALDKHTNRSALVCDEEELVALMQRYGIGDPRHAAA